MFRFSLSEKKTLNFWVFMINLIKIVISGTGKYRISVLQTNLNNQVIQIVFSCLKTNFISKIQQCAANFDQKPAMES